MKNKYIKYLDIINHIDIKEEDIVLVSSDILKLICVCRENNEKFDSNLFIDSIIKKIGPKGTILIPTYNWDFCRKGVFDYNNTKSQVGALGNVALKRKDFKRTRHPIYSFMVHGKDQEILINMDNKSSFGENSPFRYLHEKDAKNFFIGIDYKEGLTLDHYFEQKVGSDFRFHKDFKGVYINENKETKKVTYSMYVRDLKKEVYTKISRKLDGILIKNKCYTRYEINDIKFSILNLKKVGDIIYSDLLNKGGLIYPAKVKK